MVVLLPRKNNYLKQKTMETPNKKTIGGSMVAAVLGLNPYTTPYQAWEVLTGRRVVEDNPAMLRGRVAERFIAELSKEHGFSIIREQIRLEYGGFASATIDATAEYQERLCIVEFKSAANIRSVDDLPIPYLLQVQWYMGLWNLVNSDRSISSAYINIVDGWFNFNSYAIEFNQQLFEQLFEKVRQFHEKYIITDTPPPMKDSDKLAILNALEPSGIVELSNEIESIIDELEEIKSEIKKLEEKKEELENKIKLSLYDKEQGLGSRYSVSFKQQSRTIVETKQLEMKYPQIFNELKKETNFRVLRIKKQN